MAIAIIIMALMAIPLTGVAFLAKEFVIERKISVNRSSTEVFNYVKYLKNQLHYSKWVMTDPNAKMEYRGTDGTPGFVMAWDSTNKNVGKGEQEITKITEGQRIDLEIRFEKPFKNTSYSDIRTIPVSAGQTEVVWTFRGMRNYPMKVMHFLINLKKVLEKDIDISLNNLKVILEQ